MLYRFRQVSNLLKYKELEEQYLYFASPSQQNDPMEGYIEYSWRGDWIAWIGLFKNYVWQIYMSCCMLQLGASVDELKKLYLTQTEICWKDMPIIERRANLETAFAEDLHIKKLALVLGNLDFELSTIEVQSILCSLHMIAFQYAREALEADGLSFQMGDGIGLGSGYTGIDAIIQVATSKDCRKEKFLAVSKTMAAALNAASLSAQICAEETKPPEKGRILTHLLLDFPKAYMNRIPWLAFPDWYCVCFSSDYSNPALWGYYANGHRGVCLVFKNSPGEEICLTKMGLTEEKKEQLFKIEKVKYGETPIKIDFFLSLGRLWGDERAHWLIHNGERSKKLLEIFSNKDLWRTQFWINNTERFIRKSSAWAEEKECRIALDDWWTCHTKDEQRKYQYNFNDLDGIIFGINTPIEEKIKIAEIIQRKCVEHKRKDFNFYQATYNAEKSVIELEKVRI